MRKTLPNMGLKDSSSIFKQYLLLDVVFESIPGTFHPDIIDNGIEHAIKQRKNTCPEDATVCC